MYVWWGKIYIVFIFYIGGGAYQQYSKLYNVSESLYIVDSLKPTLRKIYIYRELAPLFPVFFLGGGVDGGVIRFSISNNNFKTIFNCMSEEFYLIILRKTFVLTYQYANICEVAKKMWRNQSNYVSFNNILQFRF